MTQIVIHFSLDFEPYRYQIELFCPLCEINPVNLIACNDHNAGDISDMLWLVTECVIVDFIENQIFWRMDEYFTQWLTNFDQPAAQ